VVNSAWHQIIASPFRSAAPQHRSFDFQKVASVEVFANSLHQMMSQDNALLKFRTSQIDEAILQTQFFVRKFAAFNFKRRRLAARQNGELDGSQFDLTGLSLGFTSPSPR
jgi:hypothetical protein